MSEAVKLEMHVDGLRFEGMMLCPGCGDTFVLAGYCAECVRLNVLMENKRRTDARYLSLVERKEMGIVPFEPAPSPVRLPFEGPLEAWADGERMRAVGHVAVGLLGCVGAFYFLRSAVGMLLDWSK